MNVAEQQKLICIFGLGISGFSAARYFERMRQTFFVVDTRSQPKDYEQLQKLKYCQATYLGEIPQQALNNAKEIILSPGISPQLPELLQAATAGVSIIGDLEVFLREQNKNKNRRKKIVAITGSNGKSTVTDLTCQALKATGINAVIGGNFGIPVLDYLPHDPADIYVLEVSSFQLDITDSLQADVAVILNISEDHLDRYANFAAYCHAKLKIIAGAKKVLLNADDKNITVDRKENIYWFSKDCNSKNHNNKKYRLQIGKQQILLMLQDTAIINADELKIIGNHNLQNALAVIAIVDLLGFSINTKIINALKQYRGLAHRFQLVDQLVDDSQKIDWINDSKATNVGATLAALSSIPDNRYAITILLAGGDAKASDLSPLIEPLKKIDWIILFGKDAKLFVGLIAADKSLMVNDLQQAVAAAYQKILQLRKSTHNKQNQRALVLLSPACSSLDMFANYQARGEAFVEAVRRCA